MDALRPLTRARRIYSRRDRMPDHSAPSRGFSGSRVLHAASPAVLDRLDIAETDLITRRDNE